jgi:4-amino-4-deoxy-L-arabinose transferase-like glycosyltransferase
VTHRAVVAALLALGVGARVSIAIATGNSFEFPDEAVYADAASGLLAGRGFGAEYARVPAYPLFLAVFAGPVPSSVIMLRVAQAILTGLSGVLLYALASRVGGRGPALGATAFYALDPLLVVAAGLLYPEAIAAVLMIAVTLTTLTAAREDRLGLSALSGVLLGVFVQLRPVALMLVPILAVWISVSSAGRRARRLQHAATLALVCLLTVLPWTYRNYQVYGRLMPVSTAGTRTSVVSNTEADRSGLTVAIIRKAWTQPRRFLHRVREEFVHFWELYPTRMASDNPEQRSTMKTTEPRLSQAPMFAKGLRNTMSAVSFAAELMLALVGVGLAWRMRRRETVLMVMLILAFAFGYTLFVAKLRYRIPVLPLLFVFAGIGAHALWTAVRKRAARRVPS